MPAVALGRNPTIWPPIAAPRYGAWRATQVFEIAKAARYREAV